jgi:hypothetical protein
MLSADSWTFSAEEIVTLSPLVKFPIIEIKIRDKVRKPHSNIAHIAVLINQLSVL